MPALTSFTLNTLPTTIALLAVLLNLVLVLLVGVIKRWPGSVEKQNLVSLRTGHPCLAHKECGFLTRRLCVLLILAICAEFKKTLIPFSTVLRRTSLGKRVWRWPHIALLLMFLAVVPTGAVIAATFTVTNLNNTGAGSLRQAITDANANGTGADTIAFPDWINRYD